MKTTKISSTAKKVPTTTVTSAEPIVIDNSISKLDPEDMAARYSWYYEEKESSKYENNAIEDNESNLRSSYVSMVSKSISLKDALLTRDSSGR